MKTDHGILAVLAFSCRFFSEPGGTPRFDSSMKLVEWALLPVFAPFRKSRSREPGATEMCLFPASAPLDMLELRGIWETWGELKMAG
jgi:hypothetical protein